MKAYALLLCLLLLMLSACGGGGGDSDDLNADGDPLGGDFSAIVEPEGDDASGGRTDDPSAESDTLSGDDIFGSDTNAPGSVDQIMSEDDGPLFAEESGEDATGG